MAFAQSTAALDSRHSSFHDDEPEISDECLENMLRKIGFVAACIDLHQWRQVIDQVLREREAAHYRGKRALQR